MCNSNDLDQQVLHYQKSGDSSLLLEQHHGFLYKYYRMFAHEIIDFSSYDLRQFISCYMKDTTEQNEIRRGKIPTPASQEKAHRIVKHLRRAFSRCEGHWDLNKDELYHELVIPFLTLATKYQPQGKSFEGYLMKAYRYELKRHLDELMVSVRMDSQITYQDNWDNENIECEVQTKEIENCLEIDLDEDLILNHPDWLSGKTASEPFKAMTRMDRLILAKYYYEDYTDKEIGRLVGRNLKSINRVRNRLKMRLEDNLEKGEIKWLGIRKS